MCRTFVECNGPLIDKLDAASKHGSTLDMETEFCSVSLDIIGKAVFNYDFGSVTKESPVIQSVYTRQAYLSLPIIDHITKQALKIKSLNPLGRCSIMYIQ